MHAILAILKSKRNQIEIAREAKIQESKLSKIVNGYINPTQEEMQAIASVLNCEIETIFPSEMKEIEK